MAKPTIRTKGATIKLLKYLNPESKFPKSLEIIFKNLPSEI